MSASRLPLKGRLVIATHNGGKLAEFRELLGRFDLDLVSAGELGLPEPEENGTTYAENARIKAEAAAQASGLPALADDSGLSVDALWGAPGLFSSRWAGPDKDFAGAIARVNADLDRRGIALDERRGHFVAALCLAWPDGHCEEIEGSVSGKILPEPRGDQGFGYDPVFQPDGHERSFGEMGSQEKHGVDWARGHGLSHRARAFIALAERCFEARG